MHREFTGAANGFPVVQILTIKQIDESFAGEVRLIFAVDQHLARNRQILLFFVVLEPFLLIGAGVEFAREERKGKARQNEEEGRFHDMEMKEVGLNFGLRRMDPVNPGVVDHGSLLRVGVEHGLEFFARGLSFVVEVVGIESGGFQHV